MAVRYCAPVGHPPRSDGGVGLGENEGCLTDDWC